MERVYRVYRSEDYLEHHGILGQKWGVRRYQNEDGSLTPAGIKRYGDHPTTNRKFYDDAKKGRIDKKTYFEKTKNDEIKKEIGDRRDEKDLSDFDKSSPTKKSALINLLESNSDDKIYEVNELLRTAAESKVAKIGDNLKYFNGRDPRISDSEEEKIISKANKVIESSVKETLKKAGYPVNDKTVKDAIHILYPYYEDPVTEWAYHSATGSPKYLIHYSEDYLEHHGILGMKWGVRRYQNEDGSLTSLGQKHRAQREGRTSKYEERTAKATARKTSAEARIAEARASIAESKAAREKKKNDIPKKIPKTVNIKNLSNDEIKTMTERLRLEKNLIDAQVARYPVKPKTKSYVSQLFEKVGTGVLDGLSGAVTDVGKAYIKEILAESLDMDPSKIPDSSKKKK